MRIDEIKNLKLPQKRDEEFLKINFEPLFSYDFKNTKTLEFDIMGLKTIKDENSYESVLFNITKSLDENQKILIIDKNIAEPIFIIHKCRKLMPKLLFIKRVAI